MTGSNHAVTHNEMPAMTKASPPTIYANLCSSPSIQPMIAVNANVVAFATGTAMDKSALPSVRKNRTEPLKFIAKGTTYCQLERRPPQKLKNLPSTFPPDACPD
eukprot:TRINITY_DN3863_c0_g1_i2.p2 TRINITY_DN3863_c0_g1~~TRINITY_DN3863_c0_g1_i2.p2  ORF type:complete len:104 (-),score=7.11 TRINITY_DN3863_c0_g1_i2:197-508(-)